MENIGYSQEPPSVPGGEIEAAAKGRYVYGVASEGRAVRLGSIGIGGNDVYTIPFGVLCAIVHNCPARPYQSADAEAVKNWVVAHQRVLDAAKEQFGTVIPLNFDTILESGDSATSPDQTVRKWLRDDYERFCHIMGMIQGKDEYVVQVCFQRDIVSQQISEQSAEIKSIKSQIAAKTRGMAYLYRQKLEKTLRSEMERAADQWFKDFYTRVRKHCDDIVVEKAKKVNGDKVMLLNLSCLVRKESVTSLGEELEGLNKMPGFSVHFSGPWPPYSFVGKPALTTTKEK